MYHLSGSGRAVKVREGKSWTVASQVMAAADSQDQECVGLPVASEWPVLPMVTSEGLVHHFVRPSRSGEVDHRANSVIPEVESPPAERVFFQNQNVFFFFNKTYGWIQ